MSELPAQVAITPAEIGGITNVEIGRGIELRMAACRSVRPQSAQARDPGSALCLAFAQCVGEMRRMRAIEHVVGRRAAGFAIGLLDRVADRLPARQFAVGLDRE